MSTVRAIASKVVALTLLIGFVWLALTAVVMPLAAAHAELEDAIATERALLGRLIAAERRLAASAPGSDSNLAANPGPAHLEGESDGIRLAGLQAKLGAMVSAAGLRLDSTQAVQPREEGALRLIGVQTQLAVGLATLQRLLVDIEAAEPPLFVDTVQISTRSGPGEQVQDLLDVRLIVLGAAPPAKGGP